MPVNNGVPPLAALYQLYVTPEAGAVTETTPVLPAHIGAADAVGVAGVGAAVTITLWGTAGQLVKKSETETL